MEIKGLFFTNLKLALFLMNPVTCGFVSMLACLCLGGIRKLIFNVIAANIMGGHLKLFIAASRNWISVKPCRNDTIVSYRFSNKTPSTPIGFQGLSLQTSDDFGNKNLSSLVRPALLFKKKGIGWKTPFASSSEENCRELE